MEEIMVPMLAIAGFVCLLIALFLLFTYEAGLGKIAIGFTIATILLFGSAIWVYNDSVQCVVMDADTEYNGMRYHLYKLCQYKGAPSWWIVNRNN